MRAPRPGSWTELPHSSVHWAPRGGLTAVTVGKEGPTAYEDPVWKAKVSLASGADWRLCFLVFVGLLQRHQEHLTKYLKRATNSIRAT